MATKRRRKVLGWCEWVSLPELKVSAMRVKVDSGARTSALHAVDIHIAEGVVQFSVQRGKKKKHGRRVEAPLIGYRKVRSSVGHVTERPVIQTRLQVGTESWPIEVTLINRDIMGFRMLLGRSAIGGGFFIDPSRTYLLPRPRRKR